MTPRTIPSVLSVISACLLGAVGCRTVEVATGEEYKVDQRDATVVDAELETTLSNIEKYPKRHDLYYRAAGLYFTKDDFRTSVEYLQKAIALAPAEPRYHFRLGQTYLRMQELDEAEAALRESLRLWPPDRYSGPHGFLGYVLSKKGDHEGAIAEFRKCIETDPENLDFYYVLGAQYDIVGEREQAARWFHEYLLRGGRTYRTNAAFILRKLGMDVPEPPAESPTAAPAPAEPWDASVRAVVPAADRSSKA